MKRIPPAWVLYFLAPAIGELLSGSAPPVEFFQPFGLLILPALYGSGAILARELALRWEKRWPTILVLGLAYGIVEEGLMVKSFFDPAWPDLGLLGVYGRWAGVNWVWSLFLMIYHAVYSIATPIFLIELLFPERRDERWVGRRGMITLSLLLLAVVLFGFFYLTPYRPPALPYMIALAATVGLYAVARRMPIHWWTRRIEPRISPLWFGLIGFASTLVFFFMHWILPEIGVPVPLTMLAAVLLVWMVVIVVRRMSGEGGWSDEDKLALVSGALTFFILLAPISELDVSRQDNPTGMTLVGLVAFFFLIGLRRKTRR
ncbi:MAG TPA: hypothetical protein G4O11_14100, partial [Anaerolineae bacterium]|nr:hypothetical protein [Anaerolineae bacterium]